MISINMAFEESAHVDELGSVAVCGRSSSQTERRLVLSIQRWTGCSFPSLNSSSVSLSEYW